MGKELTPENLTEKAKAVVDCYLSNPTFTYKQIREATGVSEGRIAQVLRSPRVTALYPILARRIVRNKMLPMAVKRYTEIISKSPNDAVAEKAAGRVLASEGALGQEGQNVTVNVKADITLHDVHKLREIVEKAHDLPGNVVDAEVIEDK